MFINNCNLLVAAYLGLCVANPVFAFDARSAGVGGSAIANGYGVHGALDNPSSLIRLHRQQQHFHIHSGLTVDIQDDAGIIETVIDEETLLTDFEQEIDLLSNQLLTCDINDISNASEATCLENTQKLGGLATTVFNILNRADNQPIKASAAAEFGVAVSTWSIPVALYFRYSVSGATITDFADNDLSYVDAFATSLSDDVLTLDELINNSDLPFSISADGQTLNVQQPEDVLESAAQGTTVDRLQFGFSVAHSVPIAGLNVDIGVTPKYSILTAAGINTSISEQFIDNTSSLTNQLEDTEITENTFTVDVGASTQLQALPLRLSVVARNMIKESITINENIDIETTPQLIVGSAFSIGSITLTGDIALNEAKVDNLDTQITAIGIDYSKRFFGVRAGISHDNARTESATGLSLGVSLGPLHIGGRLTDRQSAQAGAQLAFSF